MTWANLFLFITPLVGDIPTHRFFSKRRAKNLEQRMELEKLKQNSRNQKILVFISHELKNQ